jgi:hypothetical protein
VALAETLARKLGVRSTREIGFGGRFRPVAVDRDPR